MANDLHTLPEHEPRITTLVGGIVNDALELIKQQLALFKQEMQDDFARTRQAALALAVGLVMALVAGVVLSIFLAHLLAAFVPGLPLWGGYGIVAALLGAAAGGLLYAGKHKLESFNPLPDQTVDALRENLQWKTNPK